MTFKWVCCQIGAREHYSIPRALLRGGHDVRLVTDAWVPPNSPLGWAHFGRGRRLRQRYHQEIPLNCVSAFTLSTIATEIGRVLRTAPGWNTTAAYNKWFQRKTLESLKAIKKSIGVDNNIVLFAYCYAARDLFLFARDAGWRTVLGQIDPGPFEERIVADECRRYPDLCGDWSARPSHMWSYWREECNLAEAIIVNSEWSRDALIDEGIADNKLHLLPLALDPPFESLSFQRTAPKVYTAARPLRCLFLGQIILRKGIARLLEACDLLKEKPVEVLIVGPTKIDIPARYKNHPKIRWIEQVSRGQVGDFYKKADVFVLPTLSDGFAITQLEASAWGLPLIVSKSCARVVQDGLNGIVLPQVSGQEIATAILRILDNPRMLSEMSPKTVLKRYSMAELSGSLGSLQSKIGKMV